MTDNPTPRPHRGSDPTPADTLVAAGRTVRNRSGGMRNRSGGMNAWQQHGPSVVRDDRSTGTVK